MDFRFSFFLFIIVAVIPPRSPAQLLSMPAWQQSPRGYVVQKNSSFGSVNNLSLTYNSNVKAGNLLVVCTSSNNGGVLSDTSSHVWSMAAGVAVSNANSNCYYTLAKVSSAITVTLTGTGGFGVMSLLEIFGATSLDNAGTATGTGNTVTVSTGVTKDNDSFVIGYVHDWDHYVSWTPGAGFNMEVLADGNGTGYITALESKMIRSPGSKTVTFGKDYPGDTWGAIALAFTSKPDIPRLAQYQTAYVASANSISVAFPNPVNAGSTTVICINSDDATVFSDSRNGVYSAGGIGGGTIFCKSFTNTQAGTTTATVTRSSNGPMGLLILEVRGAGLTTCGNAGSAGTGNGASSVTATSLPIPSARSFVFAITGSYWSPAQPTDFTLAAGSTGEWTQVAQFGVSGGVAMGAFSVLKQNQGVSGTKSITTHVNPVLNYMSSVIVECHL